MITVGIYFENESDVAVALTISESLKAAGIFVVSNNPAINSEHLLWGVHEKDLIDAVFGKTVNYIILLLSKPLIRNKYAISKLYDIINKPERTILPVKIGKDVPDIAGVTSLRYSIFIEPNEGLKVVDAINEILKRFAPSRSRPTNGFPYEKIPNILRLHSQSNEISEINRRWDWNEEILYILYESRDSITHRSTYFLYLHNRTRQRNTYEELKKCGFSYIFANLVVLLKKESRVANPKTRKKNISEIFKPLNVFYTDEFVWEHCTSLEFKGEKRKYPVRMFIPPFVCAPNGRQYDAMQYIKDWFYTDDSPILVVKGGGGIGKTTTAMHFANLLVEAYPEIRPFLFSANTISEPLRRLVEEKNEINLFDIYLANQLAQGYKHLSVNQDVFELNYDHGNIFIIIDGLDEIISQFGEKFKTSEFLSGIHGFSEYNGMGKVIFTCRDYFWDKSQFEAPCETIELLPFNRELAVAYLSQSFPENPRAIERGLSILDAFSRVESDNERYEYIPFVLNLVEYILKEKAYEGKLEDTTFESSLLNVNIDYDYIVFKICAREIIKLSELFPPDSQLKFFINLAFHYGDSFSGKTLQKELVKHFDKSYSSSILDNIKSHPILKTTSNDNYAFRYDFFLDYFMNLHICNLIKNEFVMNDKVVDISLNYMKYSSQFMNVLSRRISEYNDEQILKFVAIIETIKQYGYTSPESDAKEKMIGTYFSCILKIMINSGRSDRKSMAELMKDLFLKDGVITQMCIYNFDAGKDDRLCFDFSDCKFDGCYVNGCNLFWSCTFNAGTYFSNSTFYFNYCPEGIVTEASKRNFDLRTCNYDKSFEEVIHQTKAVSDNRKSKSIDDVKLFLKLFYRNGYLQSFPESVLRSKYKRAVLDFDAILNSMIEHQLVVPYSGKKPGSLGRRWEVGINEEKSVINFVFEGTMSIALNKALKKLLES